ncbi:MAG: class I SAM-dependent methyltransferase [Cyclobacteriaceae bacterium]|nr:class I SAM-dependent methyltransferase [Cyclobacteriaceae bacterium]
MQVLMMELSVAVKLIQEGVSTTKLPQQWVDLGAGTGLFTSALASLLPKGSSITAVDKNLSALNTIRLNNADILLNLMEGDYTEIEFTEMKSGFLMANSLHYCEDQVRMLQKLKHYLRTEGRILIIEYNTAVPNTWVPFPVSFERLTTLAAKAGFTKTDLLQSITSKYQAGGMYSAMLQ